MIDAVGAAGMAAHDARRRDGVWPGGHAQPRGAPPLQRHAHAVECHVEIVGAGARRRGATKASATGLPHLQLVLGVERERVADYHPAAGSQRLAVHVRVLRHVAGHAVGGAIEPDRRAADGPPADGGRGRRVAFDERGRDAEHVRDVVEPGGRIVGRQQRRDVHVERQQVADRAGVFGAVEAMQRGRAGIEATGRSAIQRRLERGAERGA